MYVIHVSRLSTSGITEQKVASIIFCFTSVCVCAVVSIKGKTGYTDQKVRLAATLSQKSRAAECVPSKTHFANLTFFVVASRDQ